MEAQIKKVVEMMSPDFDWDKYWDRDDAEGLDEEFRRCITFTWGS